MLLTFSLAANALTWTDPATGIKWTYTKLTDGTASIGGGKSTSPAVPKATTGDLVVPAKINNLDVTQMKAYAFYGCTGLTSITFTNNIAVPSNASYIFYNCTETTAINLEKIDVSKAADLSNFFNNCLKLDNISGVSNWNVSSATNISNMLRRCNSLVNLQGLENWDVSNVTNMFCFVIDCQTLSDISALRNWNTSSVTNMNNAFAYLKSIINLEDLESWDVSNVRSMSYMFSDCTSLSDLSSIANWNTENVTSMEGMFEGCTALTSPNIQGNFKLAEACDKMFYGCSNMTSLNGLQNCDASGVNTMEYMFRDCSKLADVTALANWNTSSVTNMARMFLNCVSLTNMSGVENWNTGNVTSMASMFKGCSNVEDLSAVNNWDISKVETISEMFNMCSKLKTIDLSQWDISSVKYANLLFNSCTSITSTDQLGIKDWDVSTITGNIQSMFSYSGLVEVDLPDWKFSVYEYGMPYMFYNCRSLKTVNISNWDFSNARLGCWDLFYGCTNLEYVDISNVKGINSSTGSSWSNWFSNCNSLKRISKIPGGLIENCSGLFAACNSLEEITLPSEITKIRQQFLYNISPLTEVTIPANVTEIERLAFVNPNIKSVYCMATTPPTITTQTFNDGSSLYKDKTLYVKTSALEAYRNDPEWSKFGTITDQIPFTIAAGKQYSTLAVDFDADFSETEGVAPYVAAKYYEGRTAAAKVATAYQRAGMPAKAKAAANDNTIRTIVVAQFTDKYIPSRTGDDNFTFHGALIYGKPGTYYYKMGERDYASGNQVTEDWENNYMMPAYETWQLSPTYMQEPENWMCYPKNDSYNFVLKDGRFKYIDNQGSIPRHKAWLSLPAEIVSGTYQEAGAKMAITFEDGDTGDTETTGITFITEQKDRDGNVTYNLAGQQVDDAYKGMVIRNGKTFIKK